MSTLRADLHVHSRASRQSGNLKFLKSRDCYSATDEVYHTAKARGMDLVALTDHDTIEGCLEFLSAHPDCPDFIMGEEVSCRFPGTDLEVHLGVYGMTEALHRAVQPLRGNVFEVTACLREADVFFALNHLLFFYRGQVPLADYLALFDEVPAVEARNGTMLRAHNELVTSIAARWPLRDGGRRHGLLGGSDAHTLAADRHHVDRGAGGFARVVPGQPSRRPRRPGRAPRARRCRGPRRLRGDRVVRGEPGRLRAARSRPEASCDVPRLLAGVAAGAVPPAGAGVAQQAARGRNGADRLRAATAWLDEQLGVPPAQVRA